MDPREKDTAMDLEALCDELGLDRDQFAQFASLFLDVAFMDLASMKQAWARQDLAGVVEAAHSIKGAALTLELDRISGIAKALESNARAGAREKILEEMDTLALEIEKLKICFQEHGLLQKEGVPLVEP